MLKFTTSKNGNLTAFYKGFRFTRFGIDMYIYKGDNNIGRMCINPDDCKKLVDDYYDGIYTSYFGNKQHLYTGKRLPSKFAQDIQAYDEAGNKTGIKRLTAGYSYTRGDTTVEILEARSWGSNSGKTQWYRQEYKVFVNGVQQKPEPYEPNKPKEVDFEVVKKEPLSYKVNLSPRRTLIIEGHGKTYFFNDQDLKWLDEGGVPKKNKDGYLIMPYGHGDGHELYPQLHTGETV